MLSAGIGDLLAAELRREVRDKRLAEEMKATPILKMPPASARERWSLKASPW